MRQGGQTSAEHIPIFSVVMPTYNVERYIANAIGDLFAQSFTDWELIVVDDAATDSSIDIARSLATEDDRIRIVHHKHNQGLSAARNTGMESAHGRYLWIPDPDDRFDSELLATAYESLMRNPAQVVLFGHVEDYVNRNDEITRSVTYSLPQSEAAAPAAWRPRIIDLEVRTHYGYAWNKIYDLAFLHRIGARFEDAALSEDLFFNVKVFDRVDRLTTLSMTPYHYAKHQVGSLTRRAVPEYFELHERRISDIYRQLKRWGVLDDRARALLGGMYSRYILSSLERNAAKESGMDAHEQREWARRLFETRTFNDVIPYADANGNMLLAACLPALKQQNAPVCVALGSVIHKVRHDASGVFSVLRR